MIVAYTRLITPGDATVYSWILASGDTGRPMIAPGHSDKCVQLFGTFSGAAVTLQGSNEPGTPTTWETLTDLQGAAIVKTAAALTQITENPYQIRPSAGAVTSVTVLLLVYH